MTSESLNKCEGTVEEKYPVIVSIHSRNKSIYGNMCELLENEYTKGKMVIHGTWSIYNNYGKSSKFSRPDEIRYLRT